MFRWGDTGIGGGHRLGSHFVVQVTKSFVPSIHKSLSACDPRKACFSPPVAKATWLRFTRKAKDSTQVLSFALRVQDTEIETYSSSTPCGYFSAQA